MNPITMKKIYPELERDIKEISYKEEKIQKAFENISSDLAKKARITEKLEKLRNEMILKYEKLAKKGADHNRLHSISEHIASINQKIRHLLFEMERYVEQELGLLRRIEKGERIDEDMINKLREKTEELSERAGRYERESRRETKGWL